MTLKPEEQLVSILCFHLIEENLGEIPTLKVTFAADRSELLNEIVVSLWAVPSLNTQLRVNKAFEPDGIHPPLLQKLKGGIVEHCPQHRPHLQRHPVKSPV